MAWIYLAELEDSPLLSASGSDPSAIVKTTDTLRPFYYKEWPPMTSHELRFGMTLEHSVLKAFPQLISYPEASLAKTSVLQEMEQAWEASEADFILKSKGLSKKLSQLSCFLKMSLQSGHADLAVWCGDFPNSGMIVDGQLYQPKKLEPRTFVNDGSCLPTPTACDYGKNNGRNSVKARDRYSLTTMARHHLWPTPRLAERGRTGDLQVQVGGKLNPNWVEWLMWFPSGWTALEDWAMQWFRSRRGKRSKDSQV